MKSVEMLLRIEIKLKIACIKYNPGELYYRRFNGKSQHVIKIYSSRILAE